MSNRQDKPPGGSELRKLRKQNVTIQPKSSEC